MIGNYSFSFIFNSQFVEIYMYVYMCKLVHWFRPSALQVQFMIQNILVDHKIQTCSGVPKDKNSEVEGS